MLTPWSLPSIHFTRLALVACLSVPAAVHAQAILEWDLNNGTGAATNVAGSALVAGIDGGQMTGGGGVGNTGSPTDTWNRTFGTFGDFSSAMEATNYFAWTTVAASDFTVTVTNLAGFNLRSTSIGPTSAGLFYSTDGETFTQTGTTFTVSTLGLTSAAAAFGSALATNPLIFSNGQTVFWRLVAFGGTGGRIGIGAAGTSDIQFLGTSVSAIPAQDLVWNGGNGTWATGSGGWNNGSNNTNFASFDNATIGTADLITVEASGVTAGSLAVDVPSGTTTLTGGPITSPTLTKSGNGTLVLATSNTISSTTIGGGEVIIDNARALGTSVVAIDTAKLTVTNTGFTNLANTLSLGTNGTVTFEAGAVTTLTAAVLAPATGDANQTVGFAKTGAGTLTISSGFGNQMSRNSAQSIGAVALRIDSGTLVFAGSAQKNIGNEVDTGGVAWNGDVILSNTVIMSHGTKITGTGRVLVEGNASLLSRLDFGVTRLELPVAVNSALVNSNSSGAFTEFAGDLSGAGSITASGGGNTRFYATGSTFSGPVTVSPSGSAGGTQLYSQALAAASSVTVNANTNAAFVSGLAGEFAFRNTINGTFAVPIGGSGGIEVNAAAPEIQVVLGTSNTYTGRTVLQTGDFVISEPLGAIGTNDIVGRGTTGRLVLAAGSAASVTIPNNVTAAQTFTTNTSTSVVTTNTFTAAFAPGAGKTVTLSGVVSGGGLLKVSGGGDLVVANASNTYSGGTEVGTGRILFSSAAQLGSGAINFGTVSNSHLVPLAEGITLPQAVTIGNSFGANFDTGGFHLVLAQPVSQSGPGATLRKSGAGTLTLEGANTYTGNTTVAAGTLRVAPTGLLRFVIGASGVNNAVTGEGTLVTEGSFDFDLSNAATSGGSAWLLVDTATRTFGPGFSVAGFTESPAGVWSVSTNGATYRFSESTGVLSVAGGNPYNSWAEGYGLDPDTTGAPGSDPDGDSFDNAAEFAFGTNPNQGNASLLKTAVSGGNLVLSWLERTDASVTYTVQERTDLATGSWLPSGAQVTAGSGPPPPVDYAWKQISVSATGKMFYRVIGSY